MEHFSLINDGKYDEFIGIYENSLNLIQKKQILSALSNISEDKIERTIAMIYMLNDNSITKFIEDPASKINKKLTDAIIQTNCIFFVTLLNRAIINNNTALLDKLLIEHTESVNIIDLAHKCRTKKILSHLYFKMRETGRCPLYMISYIFSDILALNCEDIIADLEQNPEIAVLFRAFREESEIRARRDSESQTYQSELNEKLSPKISSDIESVEI